MQKRKILYGKRLRISILLTFLELDEKIKILEILNPRFAVKYKSISVHWVSAPQPEGPFPELDNGLMAVILGCVGWVIGWSLFFVSQGWAHAFFMIPVFIAWTFFVLLYRGVKLRIQEVI